jgi:hypothetical protein
LAIAILENENALLFKGGWGDRKNLNLLRGVFI